MAVSTAYVYIGDILSPTMFFATPNCPLNIVPTSSIRIASFVENKFWKLPLATPAFFTICEIVVCLYPCFRKSWTHTVSIFFFVSIPSFLVEICITSFQYLLIMIYELVYVLVITYITQIVKYQKGVTAKFYNGQRFFVLFLP